MDPRTNGSIRSATLGSSGDDSLSSGDQLSSSRSTVTRGDWLPKVMKKNPDLLELRERARPVLIGKPSQSFGRAFNSGKTEVKETLSHDVLLQLIMQHLSEQNMTEIVKTLEQESKQKYKQGMGLPEGTLSNLVQVSIGTTCPINEGKITLFDPLPEPTNDEEDQDVLQFERLTRTNLSSTNLSFFALRSKDGDLTWDELPKFMKFSHSSKNLTSSGANPASPSVTSPGTLIMNQSLKYAPLNSLISWLFSPINPDSMNFRKVFLLTHTSFMSSTLLLSSLITLSNPPSTSPASILDTFLTKVVTFIKYWIDNHPYDWNDKMIPLLALFIKEKLKKDEKLEQLLQSSILKIDEIKTNANKGNVMIAKGNKITDKPLEPLIPKKIFTTNLSISDCEPEEIARQMTILDYNLYTLLLPEDFFFHKTKSQTGNVGNVINITKRTEEVSLWVMTMILKEGKARDRTAMMNRMIRIAESFRTTNNFQGLQAIMKGLMNESVNRLQWTKKGITKEVLKIYQNLEELVSREDNFGRYRTAFAKARPPTLPWIEVHVSDVEKIEECVWVKKEVKKKGRELLMVNWEKSLIVYNAIVEVLRYQPVGYAFQYVYQISSLVGFKNNIQSLEEAYKRSLLVEPKNVSEFY